VSHRTVTLTFTLAATALTLGCTKDNTLAEETWARAVCQATLDLDEAPLHTPASREAAFRSYADALADLDPPKDLNPEATETYESISVITRTEPASDAMTQSWVGSVLSKMDRLLLQAHRDIPLWQADPWEPIDDEGFPCQILHRRLLGSVVSD